MFQNSSHKRSLIDNEHLGSLPGNINKFKIHETRHHYSEGFLLIDHDRIDDDQYYSWEQISHQDLEDAYKQNLVEKLKQQQWQMLSQQTQKQSNPYQEQELKIGNSSSDSTDPSQIFVSRDSILLGYGPTGTIGEEIIDESQQQLIPSSSPISQALQIRKQWLHELQIQSQYELIIQGVESRVFIKIGELAVQVEKKLIDFFAESFLQMKLPIVLVDDQIYNRDYAYQFWSFYFAYLHLIAEKELKATLERFFKLEPSYAPKIFQEKWQLSLCSIKDYFFYPFYSKSKILKYHMLCKYQMLNQMHVRYKTKSQEEIKNQFDKMNAQLAHLQMVQSFERTVYFCERQGRKQKGTQIWKTLGKTTEERMKKWIYYHDTLISI